MSTLVTFLRHGKNYSHKKGQSPYPGPRLTKEGREQARTTAEFLKNFQFDLILSSNMTRAKETAEIVQGFQKQKISVHKELSEHHKDVYEYSSLKKTFVEGAGTALQARKTIKFFQRTLRNNQGRKILIIAHGNVIRSCVGASMGFSLRKSPELNLFNCSLSSFIFKKEKLISIYYLNSTDHYKKLSFREKFKSAKFD